MRPAQPTICESKPFQFVIKLKVDPGEGNTRRQQVRVVLRTISTSSTNNSYPVNQLKYKDTTTYLQLRTTTNAYMFECSIREGG